MFDFDILDSKTLLGESGFYLYKTNEIVFLDLLFQSSFEIARIGCSSVHSNPYPPST